VHNVSNDILSEAVINGQHFDISVVVKILMFRDDLFLVVQARNQVAE